jgi:hypothetical protein
MKDILVKVNIELLDETSGDLQTAMRYEQDHITKEIQWQKDHPAVDKDGDNHNMVYPDHLVKQAVGYFETNARWHELREIIYVAEREAEKEV